MRDAIVMIMLSLSTLILAAGLSLSPSAFIPGILGIGGGYSLLSISKRHG